MLIYSFIADYQAFSLRYKDNTTRDKNETKVGKQSANLGKNNEPIQNRLSFLIDCKSVTLHHLTILSFPMVRPAWDNWYFLVSIAAFCNIFFDNSFCFEIFNFWNIKCRCQSLCLFCIHILWVQYVVPETDRGICSSKVFSIRFWGKIFFHVAKLIYMV